MVRIVSRSATQVSTSGVLGSGREEGRSQQSSGAARPQQPGPRLVWRISRGAENTDTAWDTIGGHAPLELRHLSSAQQWQEESVDDPYDKFLIHGQAERGAAVEC